MGSKLYSVIMSLIVLTSFAYEEVNILNIYLDLESYTMRAEKLIKERYDFTKANENFLIEDLKIEKRLLVTRFDFDSILIKTVPIFQFKIKEGFKN